MATGSGSTPTSDELFGSNLAAEAYGIAQRLDPQAEGLHISQIEETIERDGARIRGDNPRSVLQSALNTASHMFRRTGRQVWTWIAPGDGADPTVGISGKELLDAAYALARRLDPSRAGIHYETLKETIQREGTAVRGTNPGQTMTRVLRGAPDRFEPLGRGMYRWR